MQEGFVTALLWFLFGGTHVGLSSEPIRKRFVGRLGEGGFIFVYSVVAIVTFAALTHYVALHRFDDLHTSLIVTIPPVRGALLALSVVGFSLFITAVLVYPRLPMATFRHRVRPARGVQQVTRHPFFSGIAIWAAAHALLAPSAVTFVYFIGVVVLAFAGGMHQDRRLITELGEPYRAYVASTSFWPLVADVHQATANPLARTAVVWLRGRHRCELGALRRARAHLRSRRRVRHRGRHRWFGRRDSQLTRQSEMTSRELSRVT